MSIYSGDEDCGDEITSPGARTPEQWRRDEARDDAEDQERDEERARFAEDWHPDPVPAPDLERLRCPGCGAAFGAGCSCRDNARAIGRGEAAKCRAEEEPWNE